MAAATLGCERAGRAGGEPEFSIGNPLYSPTLCTGVPARWELGDTPVATIDPEKHELNVVSDALLWRDSLIAVAHISAGELLVFSLDGELVWRIGRKGGGPGEFRWLTDLARCRADSLAAFDRRLKRATVLDEKGSVGRIVPLGREQPEARLLGTGPDGSFYFSGLWYRFRGLMSRDTFRILRAVEGDDAEQLIALPHTYSYMVRAHGGTRGNPPFTPLAYADLEGRHLVAGRSDSTALYHLDLFGGDASWVSVPCRLTPLSDLDIRRYQERFVQEVSQETARRSREVWSQIEYPEWIPWFERLLVDRAGHVWLGERARRMAQPNRWLVVDLNGRIVARVSTPERFSPTDIGEDYVLGVERDSLDLQWVRMYPLRRNGGL